MITGWIPFSRFRFSDLVLILQAQCQNSHGSLRVISNEIVFFYNDKCFSCKVCVLYSIQTFMTYSHLMPCSIVFILSVLFSLVMWVWSHSFPSLVSSTAPISHLPPVSNKLLSCSPVSSPHLSFSPCTSSTQHFGFYFRHLLSMPWMTQPAITSAETDSKPSRRVCYWIHNN